MSTGKTSHEKGLELETLFAAHLIDKLGYKKTWVARNVFYEDGCKNVDVIGERLSEVGRKYFRLSILFLIGSVFYLCLSFYGVNTENPDSSMALISTSICVVAGLACSFASYKYNLEHVWVECKNYAHGPVSEDLIRLAISRYTDCATSKKYKFKDKYFVSTNRYIDSALEYAKKKGIICYMLKDGTFTIVSI